MWIVRLALRRPYTFIVMALLIAIGGALTIVRTPVDIFPEINIPVVSVIWQFSGLSPNEVEGRMVTISERAMTTTVNGIEHMESQSLAGVGLIRVFFQPDASIAAADAEVTAISQTLLRIMPPGTTPPLIIRYSASNVPILQLALQSPTLNEQQLYDYGLNWIRTQLATVQGAQVPLPWGGKVRQVMVDLDPGALYSKGLSAFDVSTALGNQNVILPAGTAKIGPIEYNIRTNSSPSIIEKLNDLPLKQIGDATVYMRDVAQVHDGFAVQTNVVHVDGRPSSLVTVLKTPTASTLDIVQRVRDALPRIQATLPPDLEVRPLFDQSVFVRASVQGVLREGVIAAALTGLMILLFLGSWRSTLVIVVSIPLAILVSIITLSLFGQTLNVMTLGGLALAVGILVDDATVEIENTNRNLAMGKSVIQAILDGAQQIATPAFVATLCICIVFVPVVFISGVGKYLFTPLALAVVFAMLASYFLSRTVVPTMVRYLLPAEAHLHAPGAEHTVTDGGPIWAVHQRFNRHFERFRDRYAGFLGWALAHRRIVTGVFAAFVTLSLGLFLLIGMDFFPTVDAGQLRLHVRCPPGTRIEETTRRFAQVQDVIRETIPADEIDIILDNIGLPAGGINLAFSDASLVSAADGDILISLQPEHGSTAEYAARLRKSLAQRFPDLTFFFQPADIVSQILNFGLAAPIDVQLVGRDPRNVGIAEDLVRRIAAVPGAADVRLQQVPRYPEFHVDVDRWRAQQIGFSESDVAQSLLVSLSGTAQAQPNYWLNLETGVNYPVVVQTPPYRIDSIDALGATPIALPGQPQPQLLTNLASVRRTVSAGVISHYNVQPVLDVLAAADRADLWSVTSAVQRIVDEVRPTLPRGTFITIRGQAETMRTSFTALAGGMVLAVALVYLLMAVNFQSWLDPLIILMALPGAMAGVLWMLFVTQTNISIPALMGAIMCVGVATSNSILVVQFANEQRLEEHLDAHDAALSAGTTRLRPVIMTALAMIIGMLPMSLGLGEGGEQNAPLGRVVIGGLTLATFATLVFVPVVYSVLRRSQAVTEIPPELRE
ncbi:MAG TPA: efflux RND transporter permease subunit [Candidatus Binatia bacterium]|jgi:multidrug efflux pump subunit AcrB|nr:efflux RND transporter permease subunit [Candidatus Binatia bacterium]